MESDTIISHQSLQQPMDTDDVGFEMTEDEKKTALAAVLSFMAAIIALGTIGNVLVIMAVVHSKKLQTVSNMFVANLSTCDLMFVTIVLPANMYTYLVGRGQLPESICKFVGFLSYTLTGTTVITITLIAWNRHKLVVAVGRYKRLFRPRNLCLMLAASWILPVICLLPAVFETWGHLGYIPMLSSCNLDLDSSSQSFKIFLLIVRAVIPCGLIIYFYNSIYSTTRASHQRLHHLSCSTSSMARQHGHRKEMRLTKMMTAIFVVFVISYFPCTVSSVIDWNRLLSKTIHMFCQTSVFLGSAVNPLLYGFMNEQFRSAYYEIITCKVMFSKCQNNTTITKETTTCIENDDKTESKYETVLYTTTKSPVKDLKKFYLTPEESVSYLKNKLKITNNNRTSLINCTTNNMAGAPTGYSLAVEGDLDSCIQWMTNEDTQSLFESPGSHHSLYMFQNSCI